jgi:hypothetical protein
LLLVYPENAGAVEVRGYESLRAGSRHQALQSLESGRLHLLHESSPLSCARRLIEFPVRRGPQLEGLQIRVAQQALDARRDFVGEVHDRATLRRVEETYATNYGRAGPHVAASNGARKDQDIRVVLIRSHDGIILVVDRQPHEDGEHRIEGGRERGAQRMNEDMLVRQARAVLDFNWTGEYTMPGPRLYPHQWSWDSAFIAIGYSHYDQERATSELRHLFEAQWKNGLLPQIVFNPHFTNYFPGPNFWHAKESPDAPKDRETSGVVLPPVHATAALYIFRYAQDEAKAKGFLEYAFPKLVLRHRGFDEYMTLAVYRGENAGGTDEESLRG